MKIKIKNLFLLTLSVIVCSSLLLQGCKADDELYMQDIKDEITVKVGESVGIFIGEPLKVDEHILVVPGRIAELEGVPENSNISYEDGQVTGRFIGESNLAIYDKVTGDLLKTIAVTVEPRYNVNPEDLDQQLTIKYGESVSIFKAINEGGEVEDFEDKLAAINVTMEVQNVHDIHGVVTYQNGLLTGKEVGDVVVVVSDAHNNKVISTILVSVVPNFEVNLVIGETKLIKELTDQYDTRYYESTDENVCKVERDYASSTYDYNYAMEGVGEGECYVKSSKYCIKVTVSRGDFEMAFTLLPKGVETGMRLEELRELLEESGYVSDDWHYGDYHGDFHVLKYTPFGQSKSAAFYFYSRYNIMNPSEEYYVLKNVEIETSLDSKQSLIYLRRTCDVDNMSFYMGGVVTDPNTGIKYCPARARDWSYLQIYTNNVYDML